MTLDSKFYELQKTVEELEVAICKDEEQTENLLYCFDMLVTLIKRVMPEEMGTRFGLT